MPAPKPSYPAEFHQKMVESWFEPVDQRRSFRVGSMSVHEHSRAARAEHQALEIAAPTRDALSEAERPRGFAAGKKVRGRGLERFVWQDERADRFFVKPAPSCLAISLAMRGRPIMKGS